MMNLNRVSLPKPGKESGDLLVLGVFARRSAELFGRLAPISRSVAKALSESSWKPKPGKWFGTRPALSRAANAPKLSEVQLCGLGPANDFDRTALRSFLDDALAAADRAGAKRLVLALPDHDLVHSPDVADEVLRRLLLADYSFTAFKSDTGGGNPPSAKKIQLLVGSDIEGVYRQRLADAKAIALGVSWARDLGNTPPNVANPEWMAGQAESLAEEHDLGIDILGPKELAAKGMNGILAVGGGSSSSPRLVRLEFGEGNSTISFVGKGVTFDTGGISIKPSAAMDEMKYDKCGACTVLGIMRALAEKRPDCRVRAYLPLAENMPDGLAYRPGDIVTMYGGKTVEIKNTDAEGRMILADALTWAVEEQTDHLLEFSTLTGASVVALGHAAAALYSRSDALVQGLQAAADRTGEGLWRMPLWKEFQQKVEGNHADLQNTGGRWGGGNTAAAFLWSFVEPMESFAHIDIAGTAWVEAGQSGSAGATGYGVPFAYQWTHEQKGD